MQFLLNHQIDKPKWDNCIAHADNSLIYARSFYLDALCPQWNALAGDDYEWVLPLTWRRKWGIQYLYQPAFTQQSGVFFKKDDTIPWKEIVHFLKDNYSFWEINFNYSTLQNVFTGDVWVNSRTNFILNLQNDYSSIYSNYHNVLKKNLRSVRKFGLIYQPAKDYLQCIDEYVKRYAGRMKHVTEADYNNFKQVCNFAFKNNMLLCRKVITPENEQLSTALLLTDGSRLYNMTNTTTEKGRQIASAHFLLDSIIREFSGKPLLFDFEGSDLPGVKSFYEGFGAINQPYFFLRYNNLPWPLKMFK